MMREQIARINGVKRACARAVNAGLLKKDAQPVLNGIDETVKNSPCFSRLKRSIAIRFLLIVGKQ